MRRLLLASVVALTGVVPGMAHASPYAADRNLFQCSDLYEAWAGKDSNPMLARRFQVYVDRVQEMIVQDMDGIPPAKQALMERAVAMFCSGTEQANTPVALIISQMAVGWNKQVPAPADDGERDFTGRCDATSTVTDWPKTRPYACDRGGILVQGDVTKLIFSEREAAVKDASGNVTGNPSVVAFQGAEEDDGGITITGMFMPPGVWLPASGLCSIKRQGDTVRAIVCSGQLNAKPFRVGLQFNVTGPAD